MTQSTKTYSLSGRTLASCSCSPCSCSPCGCGNYNSFVAYHIEQGKIEGIDVSGVTLAKVIYTSGNFFTSKNRAVVYVDACATSAQQAAVVRAFNGELGGVLADLANLVSEVFEIKVVPIEYRLEEGHDSIKIDSALSARRKAQSKPTNSKFCFAA